MEIAVGLAVVWGLGVICRYLLVRKGPSFSGRETDSNVKETKQTTLKFRRREPDRGGTPDREHRGRQWALLRRCRQAGWGGGWATGSRWAAPQLGKRPDEAFVEDPSVPRRWDGMKLEAGAVTGNKTSYPPGTSRALGPPDRQKGSRERAISGAPSLHGPRTGGERGAVRWWLASV